MTTRFRVRSIRQDDFFWLKDYNCQPLSIERDSIYLFFCVHFSDYSFVAEDRQGRPLGFVLGFLPARATSAYVHFLFVAEAERGAGIGSRLMHEFNGAVRRAGGLEVLLYTIRAVEFYKRLGFSPGAARFEAEVADYIQQVKGATPMSLRLDQTASG